MIYPTFLMGRLSKFIRESNLRAVEFLVEKESVNIWKRAAYYLKIAITTDMDMMAYLCRNLQQKAISTCDFNNLLTEAKHHNDMLQCLLETFHTHRIWESTLRYVIACADINVVRLLWPGVTVATLDQRELMEIVIKRGDINIFNFVDDAMPHVMDFHLVELAIKHDKVAILAMLCRERVVLQRHHVQQAANNMAVDCMMYFRENIPYHENDIATARYAIAKARLDILEKLCQTGLVADVVFMNYAANHVLEYDLSLDYFICLEAVMPAHYSIPEYIFLQAVRMCHFVFVHYVIKSKLVTAPVLDAGLYTAARRGDLGMVTVLREYGANITFTLQTLYTLYTHTSQIQILYLLFGPKAVDSVNYHLIPAKPAIKQYFKQKRLLASGYGLQKLAAIAYHRAYEFLPPEWLLPENVYLRLLTTSSK